MFHMVQLVCCCHHTDREHRKYWGSSRETENSVYIAQIKSQNKKLLIIINYANMFDYGVNLAICSQLSALFILTMYGLSFPIGN